MRGNTKCFFKHLITVTNIYIIRISLFFSQFHSIISSLNNLEWNDKETICENHVKSELMKHEYLTDTSI